MTPLPDKPDHVVKSYDQDLFRLTSMVTDMGGIVESQVALAAEAILSRDSGAAARAVESDVRVNAMEREIEAFVIQMLALRQPMADDLRRVVSALKVIGDLERIGDYAANVAKRSLVLDQVALPISLGALGNMARMVQANLKSVIDAIEPSNPDQALEVWRGDEMIDDLYNAIFRELITYMMEDPRNISPCTHLLFIAKNLERIGDHATNIAETVYYTATGAPLPDARPKGDLSLYTGGEGEG